MDVLKSFHKSQVHLIMDSRYTSNIILAAYSLSAILFCLVMYNLWSSQVRSNLNNAGAWFLLIVKANLHFTIGWMNVAFAVAFESFTIYDCYILGRVYFDSDSHVTNISKHACPRRTIVNHAMRLE
eukprot:32952_1